MAASTTWPLPDFCASSRAHTHAEGEEHAAAAEVADQIERRHRRLALAADGVQHAGERDVVDVVAGALGHRAVLAEARHAAEHQPGIDLRAATSGPSPSRSMTPGRKPSMQRVRLGGEPLDDLAAGLALDVEGKRAAAAVQHVELRLASGQAQIGRLAAVDADHLGAHVGEQHGGERRRADAGHLDDAETGERTHRGYLSGSRAVRNAPPAARCAWVSGACSPGKRFSMPAVVAHARKGVNDK